MYVQLPPPLAAQYGSSADNFYPPRQQYGVPPPIGQYSPALAGSTGAAYVQPPSVSNSAPAAITATAATATTPATPGAAPVPPVPAHLGAIPMIVPLPGIGLVPVLPHVAAREVAPVAKRERKALVIKEKDGSISEINSKAPQPAQPQAPVEPTIPASVPVRVPVPVPVNTSAAEVTVPTQNAPAPAVLEKVSAASGSSVSIEEPVATIAAPVARVQPVEIAAPKTEPPPLATVAAAPDQDEHFHSAKSQHSSQPAEEVLHTQVHTETHILSSKSDAFHSAKSHISTSITPEPTAEATSALPESDVDVDDEGTASSRYESHGYPSSYDNSLVSTREPTPTPSISASPSMESLSSIRVHDQRQALSRTSAAATPEPDSMEDWEKAAADLPALPAPVITSAPSVTPPQRSLRPGGGLGVQKLNIGAQNQPKGPKREYSREEIMKCRPAQQPEKPPILVTLYSGVSENGGNREKKPIVGYWVRVTASTTREYKDKSSDRGQGGQRESGAGGYRESTHRDEPSGGDRWDRGAKQGPVPTQDPRGGRGKKLPPMSRPMKEIADPVEKLSNDVRAILNKITPQTFSKLTEQLCQIPIGTNAMLDKLIELVFEKAVNEPSFANLYSDMCQALENESRHWAFLQIVHLKDTNEYSWIQDLETDNDVAGPFNSPKDAVADVMSDSPKNPVQQTIKVTVSEVIITSMGPSQVLLKIFSDSAVAPGSSQYFISCELFERERIKIADDVYETHESATKQAVKKNSFRNRLLQVCQREFINAVDRSSAYGEVEQVRQRLKETAKSLSEEERNLLESDLEDKEFKAKRRMLGNVRFIGELCKKTLISASVMHHIIKTLTCVMNENDEPIDFKDPVPEHDLEMLCKLMHTSGALLEQDAKKNKAKHGGHFEWYFEKIAALSQDKKYSSRIRFSLDEVLDLRKCSWQARRKEEGPATIDAIHAKVAQEEAAKAMGTHQGKGAYGDVRQQQQFGSPAYGSGAPRGPGGPNKPGSAPKILPRPAGQDARQIGASSPLIGKGVQGKGGYAPSPDARDKGSSSKKGGTSSPAPSQILSRTSAHSKGDQKPASVSTERAAAESAPALSSATTSGSEPLDPKLVKRIASLVSEYARMGDIGEVLLVLAAMPPSALGTVVLASITEYLATGSKAADEEKRERIVSLLKALSDQLAPASELIHTALGGCLELANLNDTIVDCPQVRQLFYTSIILSFAL